MLSQLPRALLLTAIVWTVGGCAAIDELFSAPPTPAAAASEQANIPKTGKSAPGARKPSAARAGKASPANDKVTGDKAANGKTADKEDKEKEGEKPSASIKEEDGTQAEASDLKLVGLDQTELARALGPPMAETEKAPGKVWRYWNSHCVVDVSLYLDVQSRSYRVLAYEVTNHDNSAGGKSGCLAELPKSGVQPAYDDGR